MAKPSQQEPKQYEQKLAIKGDFLDVFKAVKKDKEKRLKEAKKASK